MIIKKKTIVHRSHSSQVNTWMSNKVMNMNGKWNKDDANCYNCTYKVRLSMSPGYPRLTTGIPVGKPVGMKLVDPSFW